jgi:hypothetical protein
MNNIRPTDPYEEARLDSLIHRVETIMLLHEWGFERQTKLIARFIPNMILPAEPGKFPTVIYDSDVCRVMFAVRKNIKGDDLTVAYGRAHAPNDEQLMKWNGKDCYCWHWDVHGLICKFLDGMSPVEAVLNRGEDPAGLKVFFKLGLASTLDDVEFPLRYHQELWKYYGARLFELFDVRRPELWEAYARFVREYYDRYRRSRGINPPLDKIC